MARVRLSKIAVMVKDKHIAASVLFVVAFVYYILLSAKEFTWLFASGDSGDWLAASRLWIVPQPYGSPLFILLGHAVNLLPGDRVINMTILLSALPAAVTVALTYLIALNLTSRRVLALVASLVLLGAAVPLSQATVLEQYSLAVMLITLAYYFVLLKRYNLAVLMLGLGLANHIFVLFVIIGWLVVLRRRLNWKQAIPILAASGVLPYSLILYLMSLPDAPHLLAGGLGLAEINSYIGSTGVLGGLAFAKLPERLLDTGILIISSFSIALYPAVLTLIRVRTVEVRLLTITVVLAVWYYATCLDPTGWPFLVYAGSSLAVAAAVGLSAMYHNKTSTVSARFERLLTPACLIAAVILVLVNAVNLNAAVLAKRNPEAMIYYRSVFDLPDGTALVMDRGGFEALAVFHAIADGKQVVPIFYTPEEYYKNGEADALHESYIDWLKRKYGVSGYTTDEMVNYLLDSGSPVYAQRMPDWRLDIETWKPRFETEEVGNARFVRITGIKETAEQRYSKKDDTGKSSVSVR